jgi:hypothetical protein
VLLRAILRTRRGLNTTESNDSALHALRRLSTIASALGHQKDQYPDDVSTRGDVDACSRASRARHLINSNYIIEKACKVFFNYFHYFLKENL